MHIAIFHYILKRLEVLFRLFLFVDVISLERMCEQLIKSLNCTLKFSKMLG